MIYRNARVARLVRSREKAALHGDHYVTREAIRDHGCRVKLATRGKSDAALVQEFLAGGGQVERIEPKRDDLAKARKLTREEKRRVWSEPESNAGAGWDRHTPSGRVEDPDDYEKRQNENGGS